MPLLHTDAAQSIMVRQPPGRREKSEDERFSERIAVYFQPPQVGKIEAAAGGKDTSVFIREVVMDRVDGPDAAALDTALQQSRLKFLTKAPAGPWNAALDMAGEFVLSKQVADELEVRNGDVVVRVEGQSMEGRGIPDGCLLLMRPLPEHGEPRRGEITLVQAIDADENYFGAIKAWIPGDPPTLQDGDGNPCELPLEGAKPHAVAVARGIIGKIAVTP